MQLLDALQWKMMPALLCTVVLLACLECGAAAANAEAAQKTADGQQVTAISIDYASGLTEKINAMADELLTNLSVPAAQNRLQVDGLLVCTFVDLKKMYRTSSFGRYIAEQLMSDFQRRNFRVVELRKSRSVQIQEKYGEYGLSRDPAEINNELDAGLMLTGTYMATANDVIVNAKLMDNQTASLLSSATIIFPRNMLMDELLADSSSALKRPRGPVYMKKLEL